MQPLDQQGLFYSQIGALLKLAILAMLLERGLAFIFEHDWYQRYLTTPSANPEYRAERNSRFPGLKGMLAFGASALVCWSYNIDIFGELFSRGTPSTLGRLLTSMVVAGGSAGAIKIFQGVLGLHKDARDASVAAKIAEADAAKVVAQARVEVARAQIEEAKAIIARSSAPNSPG